MRILIYHPVLLPVRHYGGTERVLVWLAESLKKLGHEVSVFASPGSDLGPGIKVLTDEKKLKTEFDFDVLHSFTKLGPEWDEITSGKILYTIHGNGKLGESFHRNTVFLSKDHAKRHGSTCFVYNGLNPDELHYSDRPRPNRHLFLSKTSLKTKNLKGAIEYSQKAKVPLLVAGGDRPLYLKAKVKFLEWMGQGSAWWGSVDQAKKAEFLTSGRALLFPILWNEPFGLVVIEALMSGTPVFANPFGSMPELLSFAPGLLPKSESDWIKMMRGEGALPTPQVCRDYACAYFHQDQMAKNYLALYEKVALGESLNADVPSTQVAATDIGGGS